MVFIGEPCRMLRTPLPCSEIMWHLMALSLITNVVLLKWPFMPDYSHIILQCVMIFPHDIAGNGVLD